MHTRSLSLLALLSACQIESDIKDINLEPVAQIDAPTAGATLIEGTTVTFSGSGEDPDHDLDELEAAWWFNGEQACGWAPLDGSETTCDVPVPVLGDTTVELIVRDPRGVTHSDLVDVTTARSSPPEVSISAPLDGSIAYADVVLDLLGSVSDDLDAPEELAIAWESDRDGVVSDGAAGSGGEVSGSVQLSAGTHTLTLRAEDSGGEVGTDAITLTVFETNTAPFCAFTAPDPGVRGDNQEITTLAIAASDGEEAPEALTVRWSSDVSGLLGEGPVRSDGTADLEVTGLPQGAHTFTATVSDTGGQQCTAELLYTFGSAPLVTIDAPTSGALRSDGDAITFAATISDADETADQLSLQWESDLDGTIDTSAADSSGSAAFSLGGLSLGTHTVTLTATDSDGMSGTDTITVEINGRPGAPSVSLSPDPAATDDDISVSIDTDSTDPEGDPVSYRYAWTVDGATSGASTSATLPASATARDQTWTVTVTPNDGHADGATATASITIDNTAPEMSTVSLSPDPAYEGDTLTCSPTSTDIDSDTVSHTYAWTVGGSSISASGSTLSSAYFDRGDTVACTVTPSDGTDSGSSMSDSVSVENRAPEVTTIAITPTGATVEDALSVSVSSTDADGDSVSHGYAWRIGGATISTSSTASSGYSKGDTVTVEVTPNDGTDDGTTATASITIENTPPEAPEVSIYPTTPEEGVDDLECTIDADSPDVDGDSITYTITWEADGAIYPDDFSSAVGPSTTTWDDDTVPAADTALAVAWTCTATPDDGDDEGDTASATVSTICEQGGTDWGEGVGVSGVSLSHASNYLLGQQTTLTSAITLTGFGIELGSGSSNIIFALYEDNSGVPGDLVAYSDGTAVASGSNEIHAVDCPISVPAGRYWLMKVLNSSANVVGDSSGSSSYHYVWLSYGTTLPDPFPSTYSTQSHTQFAMWLIGD